jgi:hypothetical protein
MGSTKQTHRVHEIRNRSCHRQEIGSVLVKTKSAVSLSLIPHELVKPRPCQLSVVISLWWLEKMGRFTRLADQ